MTKEERIAEWNEIVDGYVAIKTVDERIEYAKKHMVLECDYGSFKFTMFIDKNRFTKFVKIVPFKAMIKIETFLEEVKEEFKKEFLDLPPLYGDTVEIYYGFGHSGQTFEKTIPQISEESMAKIAESIGQELQLNFIRFLYDPRDGGLTLMAIQLLTNFIEIEKEKIDCKSEISLEDYFKK